MNSESSLIRKIMIESQTGDYDSDSEDTVSIRKMRHEQEKELKAKA